MEENKNQVEENWLQKHLDDFASEVTGQLKGIENLEMLILKSHLLAEYYLNDLVLINFQYSYKKLSDPYYGFKRKIDDLRSKKIFDDWEYRSLSVLNSIRNNMSHTLHYSIGKSDIDNLGQIIHNQNNFDYVLIKNKSKDNKELLINILVRIIVIPHKKIANYLSDKNDSLKSKT